MDSIAEAFGDESLAAVFKHLYETRLAMSERFDRHVSSGGLMDYHEFVVEQPDRSEQTEALEAHSG